jgi:hypothetical protein
MTPDKFWRAALAIYNRRIDAVGVDEHKDNYAEGTLLCTSRGYEWEWVIETLQYGRGSGEILDEVYDNVRTISESKARITQLVSRTRTTKVWD